MCVKASVDISYIINSSHAHRDAHAQMTGGGMFSVCTTDDPIFNGHWGLHMMTRRRPFGGCQPHEILSASRWYPLSLLGRCWDAITWDRVYHWDTTVTRYYTRLTCTDGSWADVKLNEIRRSVPPTVKWTITSDPMAAGTPGPSANPLAFCKSFKFLCFVHLTQCCTASLSVNGSLEMSSQPCNTPATTFVTQQMCPSSQTTTHLISAEG